MHTSHHYVYACFFKTLLEQKMPWFASPADCAPPTVPLKGHPRKENRADGHFVGGAFSSLSVGVHCDLLQKKKGGEGGAMHIFLPQMGCKHPSCICVRSLVQRFLQRSAGGHPECGCLVLGALQTGLPPADGRHQGEWNGEATTSVQNATAETCF